MATFLSQHDVSTIESALPETGTPNLVRSARIMAALVEFADNNSDGWAYWQAPRRASARLADVLGLSLNAYYRGAEIADITEADLRDLCKPIKAFLTKRGIDHGMDLPWAVILP
jgi:hypothetical protein